ncbi:unnamed protein product [Heligmosomoides polygyrus]|uniref:RxLR effector protein n=1 Tax=Heligmosomoides polygyrus TaxID=6339 RepID=A0A183GCE7_HELPZ|nr:unnamed protein product [Heligmosomoides polygyrus]
MWQLKLVFLLIGLVLAKIRKTDIHVFGTNNAHQTMYISFMHHMVVPARITKEMMERNGYVLERSEGDAPEESSNSTKLPDAEREFNYTIRVMKNGGVGKDRVAVAQLKLAIEKSIF